MRIPTLYRYASWQRFISGLALGGVISWIIFIFMFGVMQDKQAVVIHEQEEKIAELEKEKGFWQGEFQDANKKLEEKLTVQEIEVEVVQNKNHKLDLFVVNQIIEQVKKDLNMVKAKNLETVYETRELLKRAIENRPHRINNKQYKLKVVETFVWTTLYIKVSVDLG